MKTDTSGTADTIATEVGDIRDECRDIRILLASLERYAIQARGAMDEAPKRAAMKQVERELGTITAALTRVAVLAGHRGTPSRAGGIPDPVTDLDQDPQD